MPKRRLAICEFSTLNASFEDDLRAYAAAGVEGISICELKLVEGRKGEQLEAFRASGLEASSCVPAVPTILPIAAMPGPDDPEERVEAIRAGMRRLAPFEPAAFVCPTGPPGALPAAEARRVVVESLRVLGEEGERLGVPVGLEPMSSYEADEWTIPTTLGEAAELIDEAGSPGLGLVVDTWHLWDTPQLDEELERLGDRIVAVHVNDWREPTRSWCDRALPGDGVAGVASILDAVERAGWTGFYDLEVFSDDGTFGNDLEDSLWKLPAEELARRGREAFDAVCRAARGGVMARNLEGRRA